MSSTVMPAFKYLSWTHQCLFRIGLNWVPHSGVFLLPSPQLIRLLARCCACCLLSAQLCSGHILGTCFLASLIYRLAASEAGEEAASLPITP